MSSDIRVYVDGDFIYTMDGYSEVHLFVVVDGEIFRVDDGVVDTQPVESRPVFTPAPPPTLKVNICQVDETVGGDQ